MGYAAIQEAVPSTMRGQFSALYPFIVNLIGLGLGPTLVAHNRLRIWRAGNGGLFAAGRDQLSHGGFGVFIVAVVTSLSQTLRTLSSSSA